MATTITKRYSGPSGTRELAFSRSATGIAAINGESVANGQTAFLINIAIDVSAVKAFWLESDVAVTIKTNSSGSPDNTLTLIGGEPYLWNSDDYAAFLLTADVTKFYVANASGSAATIYCFVDQDSTP